MKKSTKILSGIFLCGLALGFGAVFSIALLGGVQILPVYRMEPEDILPGAQTVLLLKHPEAKDIAAWSALFPPLLEMHVINPDAVAMIRDASGALQIIAFTRKTSQDDGGCTIGKYRIISMENSLCPDVLNVRREGSLRKERGYKALGKTPKGYWAFVRRDAIPNGPDLMSRILESSVLSLASHIRISRENDDRIVTLWPVTSTLQSFDQPTLPARNAIFSLGAGNLRDAVERIFASLSPADRLTARGVLLTQSAALFGPDISLEYTLLPLLQENSTVSVTQTASGSRVLIGGSAAMAVDATNAADALHTAFRLRHPDTAITERTFDGRFLLKTMRVSEERISSESGTIHGWEIRVTRDSEDDRLIITALRGREILISDAAELLIASLGGNFGPTIPATRRPIAKKTVLATTMPVGWLLQAPLIRNILPSSKDQVMVVVEQLGETGYVRIQEQRE